MIPGMAYFVRRLLENTSNQSWLRASFSDEVSDDVLLASPHGAASQTSSRPRCADAESRRPSGHALDARPSKASATACR